MTDFKIYHRDAMEKKLIQMAKLNSASAISLQKQVFRGVPATTIGVVVFRPQVAGLIFLSEIKDEPISHHRTITGEWCDTLAGVLFQMPPVTGQVWAKVTLAQAQAIRGKLPDDEHGKRAKRILSSKTLADCTEIIILKAKGLAALSPDSIIGCVSNPYIGTLLLTAMAGKEV